MSNNLVHFIRKLAVCLLLVMVLASGGSLSRAQDSQGTVVADNGFRPMSNGLPFENYGNDVQPVNLLPADLRRMFGDAVCARISGEDCTLTPPAKQWMESMNNYMGGGHCDGFSALAMFMYANEIKPDTFGADGVTKLVLPNNVKLQREIAYWWTTQGLDRVEQAKIFKTPSEILDILIKSLQDKSEYYTVGIFKRKQPYDGHAITPYEVIDKGDGLYWVMVYDNNFPGDESRHIDIDRNKNTWQYFAATKPDEPGSLYEGDAQSLSLGLTPNSTREGQAPCPFCAGAASAKSVGLAAAAPTYNEITLDSHSADNKVDVLITDSQGHKLGWEGGKFYNEISGASEIRLASGNLWDDSPSPAYRIPTGLAFTVTLSADAALKKEQLTDVLMVGPGYDLAVEDVKVAPGETDTIDFSPDGKSLKYTPSSAEAPNIVLGVEHTGADYAFTIQGAGVEQGASILVKLDYDAGTLSFQTVGNKNAATYGLELNRVDNNEDVTYTHSGFQLNPKETVVFQFGKWDGKGDLPIGIDAQSDGTVDSTQNAPNQHK